MLSVIGFIESENWFYARELYDDTEIGLKFHNKFPKVIPLSEYASGYDEPRRGRDDYADLF